MLSYVFRRLLWALMLFFVITLITFVVFFVLPADSRNAQRNEQGFAAGLQTQLQHPRLVRPTSTCTSSRHIVHGDLGHSTRFHKPVTQVLRETLPVTASLVIGGMVICAADRDPDRPALGAAAALADRPRVDAVRPDRASRASRSGSA